MSDAYFYGVVEPVALALGILAIIGLVWGRP